MEFQYTKKEETLIDPNYRKMACCSWIPETVKFQIIWLHGYAEHLRRYSSTAERLCRQGAAVHMMDLPGHGFSGGARGHIDDFKEYIDNLGCFFSDNPNILSTVPTFLFGHSTGGLISILYALQYNPKINGIIITSPLTGLPLWSLPMRGLAYALSSNYRNRLFPKPMDPARLCRDPGKLSDYTNDPLRVHTISPNLFLSLFRNCERAQENAFSLDCPILMFSSTADSVVSSDATQQFFNKLSSHDKHLIVYTRAMHELLQEKEGETIEKIMLEWILERC